MNALPVGRTIAAAYGFLVTRFASIVGIVWLPLLIGAAAATSASALRAESHVNGMFLVAMLVAGVANAMALVGVMQLALGQRKPGWIFFSLRAPVWRLIATNLLAMLATGAFVLIAILVVMLLRLLVGAPHIPLPHDAAGFVLFPFNQVFSCQVAGSTCPALAVRLGMSGAEIVALLVVCYVIIRLTFFIPAVVVAEESITLEQPWMISAGNFWRILAVYLGVVAPVALAGAGLLYVVSTIFTGHGSWGGDHQALAVTQALQGAPAFLIASLGIGFVQQVIAQAVLAGAVSNAYNAVTAPVTTGLRAP